MRFESQFSRMNCHRFSTEFSSGHLGGSAEIEQQDGMGTRGDLATDLGQVQVHGLGVAVRHQESGAFAFSRADRPEDPGQGSPQIALSHRSGAPPSPAAGDLRLLPDPDLILEPQLYLRVGGQALADLRQTGGEVFFLSSGYPLGAAPGGEVGPRAFGSPSCAAPDPVPAC